MKGTKLSRGSEMGSIGPGDRAMPTQDNGEDAEGEEYGEEDGEEDDEFDDDDYEDDELDQTRKSNGTLRLSAMPHVRGGVGSNAAARLQQSKYLTGTTLKTGGDPKSAGFKGTVDLNRKKANNQANTSNLPRPQKTLSVVDDEYGAEEYGEEDGEEFDEDEDGEYIPTNGQYTVTGGGQTK